MNDINEKLLKPYDAKETEDRVYELWEKSGFFQPGAGQPSADNPNKDKTYTIVIPPPNVTGSLHMGHALNATIQDILIRQKRMQGYKTLWVPGTDHAGIATQNVVEKKLKKEGLSRHDLGKEKFIEKVWEWKKEYGNIILGQLKKIGASCDWSRTKFTMDEDYAEAVKTAFLHYHKKGWIYQGDRVVNWCVRCQTSLSDLELEYEDEKGKLWYIKYPVEGGDGFIVVATTRPETMLGDSAVAVNPKDERYKELVGKTAVLPIVNREIPIVADRMIELEFGTGAVKITPAHDMLDFEIGERNNLPVHKIINQYGKMTAEAGKEYEGLSVKDAREKVVAELEKLGLIEKIEDYDHRVSKCYRCGRVIEPQISKQWFLKMDELAEKAKEAVRSGEVSFHPKRWEKVYLNWLDNVKDWCISRQIWWGHKIPLEGVDDVLDTWFSSA
ncbi:MAG: valine--tRNA ligase, partial [bacterium]|nr:valine--tRNA ligase [bacterium]